MIDNIMKTTVLLLFPSINEKSLTMGTSLSKLEERSIIPKRMLIDLKECLEYRNHHEHGDYPEGWYRGPKSYNSVNQV
jgi:hypothetical protein